MLRALSAAQQQIAFILVVPHAPKRLVEPRLQRELPPQVSDLIHACREAGHPYKFTTKDVRAIIRYVSDKPEPARPSFFTEALRIGNVRQVWITLLAVFANYQWLVKLKHER